MTDEERKILRKFEKKITNYENNLEVVMELDILYVEDNMRIDPIISFHK